MSTYAISTLQLPWSITNEDELFNKILKIALIIFLIFAIPMTWFHLPEPTRAEKEQMPPQLARIMLEKQELPKPPEPKPEEKKPEEKKPDEKKPDEKKIVEKTPDKSLDKPVKNDVKAVDRAREKAANSGLMQLKDDLMDMRESLQTDKIENAAAEIATGNQAVQAERSGVFNTVRSGSGGINAGSYSRDTGGIALSGRETTKVKSGLAEAGKKAAVGSGSGNSDGHGGAARSEEGVSKVMDQNKGAISNIYYKALRDNAALEGKVIIKMVIDPSGRIVDVTIVYSELKDPELEAKILQRVRLIVFPEANVERTTLNYTFNFLPQ